MTGFGRTGKTFAGEWLNTRPDIICLSKGLTGGTMAMGVTACSQRVFDAFLGAPGKKTFYHGHSFTANPIACAAALASLDLLEKEDCQAGIQRICNHHTSAFCWNGLKKNLASRFDLPGKGVFQGLFRN
jgi:adenosylmethionine-8-amino-7-oxononanoate aminotransferase